MVLLRRPDQAIHTVGFAEDAPPPGFADAAYEAGLEPGSGVVRFYPEAGYVRATVDGIVAGARVHLRVLAGSDELAMSRLLEEIRRSRPCPI